MRRTTQILVVVIGVVIVGIALVHLVLGGAAVIGGSPLNATAEGGHRFFAALFLCYGLAFLWCVPGIEAKRRPLNLLAAVLLFGGLARLVSVAISGPPNAFYAAMLVVELVVPFAVFFATSGCRNPPESKGSSIRYRMHSPRPPQPQCRPISAP